MAGKIAEYKIVYDEYGVDFSRDVTAYLEKGWELYGELKMSAVFGSHESDTGDQPIMCFAQALVRRKPDEFVGG